MPSQAKHLSPTAKDPQTDPFVHPQALCESTDVGCGTNIWPFAHVMAGAVIGEDCNISDHVFIDRGAVLGDRVTVKNGAMIWNGIIIADDVFIGPGVIFTNDLHPRSRRAEHAGDSDWKVETTRVEHRAAIGAGAVLLGGITIGARSPVRTRSPPMISGSATAEAAASSCSLVFTPTRKIASTPHSS